MIDRRRSSTWRVLLDSADLERAWHRSCNLHLQRAEPPDRHSPSPSPQGFTMRTIRSFALATAFLLPATSMAFAADAKEGTASKSAAMTHPQSAGKKTHHAKSTKRPAKANVSTTTPAPK
jgi:hypothetical protein